MLKTENDVKGKAADRLGDCFVVINSQGQCWDGEEWIDSWCSAVQFRRPLPAYELCSEIALEAERISGIIGMVCYIPLGTPTSFMLEAFPDYSRVELRDAF